MSDIRVRFAPSPTGYLHIGGARTALYNWLFARQNGGTFILRIEDTDRERSTDESVQAILDGMRWLGLDWDEGPGAGGANGPYFQTERMEIYKEHVQKLLDEGKAYRCYATKEELDAMRKEAQARKGSLHYDRRWRDKGPEDWPDRPYVIRFKAPVEGEIVVRDLIKGTVSFRADQHVDDFVIARSDGTPTYNFTVVVDDVTMGMTHVIRGDDHLNNTPKQVLLYEAFGYPTPLFAHLPMILGSDKTRLSKRHGATSVMAYAEMGYLPHAMLNYLARLGWSSGDEEVFSPEELVEKFRMEQVGKSAGIFNPEKLDWLNHHYIQNDPPEDIARRVLPFLKKEGIETEADERLTAIVKELRLRGKTLAEIAEKARFFYRNDFEYDPKADAKFLKETTLPVLEDLLGGLESLETFDEKAVETVFTAAMERFDLKLGKVAQPVRVAVTGTTMSPGIFETLALLGKDETLFRLKRALEHIKKKAGAQ